VTGQLNLKCKNFNPSIPSLEWLNKQAGFQMRLLSFRWDVFPFIFNRERSACLLTRRFEKYAPLRTPRKRPSKFSGSNRHNESVQARYEPLDTVRHDAVYYGFVSCTSAAKQTLSVLSILVETDEFCARWKNEWRWRYLDSAKTTWWLPRWTYGNIQKHASYKNRTPTLSIITSWPSTTRLTAPSASKKAVQNLWRVYLHFKRCIVWFQSIFFFFFWFFCPGPPPKIGGGGGLPNIKTRGC